MSLLLQKIITGQKFNLSVIEGLKMGFTQRASLEPPVSSAVIQMNL